MKFTKMHGIGNDYVYVNGFTEKVADKSAAAVFVSDRHFGIGSDGLIFINPSDKADFEMEMYNSDGSRAEMCGNGIRCVSKYVYDNRMTDKTTFTIETLAGIKVIELTVDKASHTAISARVDMGAPILEPVRVPVDEKQLGAQKEECTAAGFEGAVISRTISVDGKNYDITAVSMGNPHAIVFIENPVADFDLEHIGPQFETHAAFPKKTNTEFVRVLDRNTVEMRVWERGAGETLACGTGASATAVACILNDLTENEVTVKLLGGDLKISWDGNCDSSVFMEGTATTVFTGEINLPEE